MHFHFFHESTTIKYQFVATSNQTFFRRQTEIIINKKIYESCHDKKNSTVGGRQFTLLTTIFNVSILQVLSTKRMNRHCVEKAYNIFFNGSCSYGDLTEEKN